MFLFAPIGLMLLYANARQDTENECEGIDRAERMRGLYENKIRFFCGPEKIFEIFATKRNEEGKMVMSFQDFYKAVTPYCYASKQDPEEYFKRFQPKTIQIIDADNSGELSFTEFFFFILLMQIPVNTMRKEFSKYPDSLMNHEQFSKTLRKLRKKTTTGNRSVDTVKIDARQIHASEDEFFATNKGLVDNIFKQRTQINYNDFLSLRSQIHEDLLHYDFFTYELDDNDTISIEDFLKSTITCVNPSKHGKYLKQISKVAASLEEAGEA